MFDAETKLLIAGAPAFEGLNLELLPQRLTDAYASIVTARIQMRDLDAIEVPAEIVRVGKEMKRIGYANEALVSIAPGRHNRAAAAFVAGTAHHVALMAERLSARQHYATHLTLDAIAPEVSATLLFLIAEAAADAAEMAKAIQVSGDDIIETQMLKAIVDLATGNLSAILSRPLPTAESIRTGELSSQGVSGLLFLLLKGVRLLAEELLGQKRSTIQTNQATDIFRSVMALSIDSLNLESDAQGAGLNMFPGPHHLASLLISVSRDVVQTAVVKTPPPGDVDASRWATVLRTIAKRRPYLWRNHRVAIESGYLEAGKSAVISFPTGAGKSTLAELKIATMLLRGKKVIFLAPTLALVDQTAAGLRQTFPAATVQRERGGTLDFDDFVGELPAVSVMTTERCLALLGYDRETFSEVGLLVFDECHLLHPPDIDRSRRAIDAMLCVLNFVQVAPQADLLLLSAMMKNTVEIANWVGTITGRPCEALSLTWKPTRQVRGCVVYEATRIDELNSLLRRTKLTSSTSGVPTVTRRALTAIPFGLFCLNQTWSQDRADYSLLPILTNEITLATGTSTRGDWYLTPNGNKVAAAIAIATAKQNLKTLVFVQTITFANSLSASLNSDKTGSEIVLTDAEQALLTETIEELGDSSHSYISKLPSGNVSSMSVCHHGLLLPAERHLHEFLFRRRDGVHVMVATSTLAQGMNLPSEVVIIGGDSRFDSSANKIERLEAHELLNAAGRAGRAGESSYGFVLVVPSKVVHFSDDKNQIHEHWADLQAIFAQSDQCVTIDDPFTALLDQVQLAPDLQSELVKYFVSRLPVGQDIEEDEPARNLLLKSLAGFRARAAGNQLWLDSRIAEVLAARKLTRNPATPTWVQRLAATTGVSPEIIEFLSVPLLPVQLPNAATTLQWRDWYLEVLTENSSFIPQLIRNSTLEGMLGKTYKALETDKAKGEYALNQFSSPFKLWMQGATLAQIEVAMGAHIGNLGRCDLAREFVLRIVPELAFAFGLPLQIILAMKKGTHEELQLPGLGLTMLSACVREGFDVPEKLALRRSERGRISRVSIHQRFNEIKDSISPAVGAEDLAMAVARVKQAIAPQ